MRNRILIPSAAVTLFCCVIAYLLLGDLDVYAQQRARIVGPSVKQTASVVKIESGTNNLAFNKAAAENNKLRYFLSWNFGGKAQ
ncbi:MAG: hypothetical protein ABI857_13260, partial [Acidobacteriota bacterium]